MQDSNSVKRFGTVKQVSKDYPACSTSSLRYLIFHGNENGFAECVRRIGRKVLIDYDAFERWIDQQRERAA